MCRSPLALLGGKPAIDGRHPDLFHWPIVTDEDEQAVMGVLRAGAMSGTEITLQFEREFAQWMDLPHALATCNGTAALLASMWACGVGMGDQVICPSMTYWASALPALQLGATVNFADIDPRTLCIDPADIEHRIGPRTRAIVVVHYAGHPCDMDAILPIARRHGVKVIEDVSHAQGSLYHGQRCGALSDIAAMSMMAGKSFAIGEGGMIVTRDRSLYERCVAFGHYERTGVATAWHGDNQGVIRDPGLRRFAGLPIGGVKHRLNQTCAAMGRVQLRHYPARIAEIQKAMNRFWSLLEGTPGIRPHRPELDSGSTMGGWYTAKGLYRADELGGLSCERFARAVTAEGYACRAGANAPLHLHPLLHECDIFGTGRPTSVAFASHDVRQGPGTLPICENVQNLCFSIPWFKHDRPELIEQYAQAFRKVALHADEVARHWAKEESAR
jgi:dTDP-4-amino-4,6-dideoxygalactose transaminase